MSAGQGVDVKDLPPEVLEPAAASAASLPIAHERADHSANAQPAGGQSASARLIDARPSGAQSAGVQAGGQSGGDWLSEIGRAYVWTPVTTAQLVLRLVTHTKNIVPS